MIEKSPMPHHINYNNHCDQDGRWSLKAQKNYWVEIIALAQINSNGTMEDRYGICYPSVTVRWFFYVEGRLDEFCYIPILPVVHIWLT